MCECLQGQAFLSRKDNKWQLLNSRGTQIFSSDGTNGNIWKRVAHSTVYTEKDLHVDETVSDGET